MKTRSYTLHRKLERARSHGQFRITREIGGDRFEMAEELRRFNFWVAEKQLRKAARDLSGRTIVIANGASEATQKPFYGVADVLAIERAECGIFLFRIHIRTLPHFDAPAQVIGIRDDTEIWIRD